MKYTVNIIHDEYAESPREFDNLGTIVCFHRRYNLGDKHYYDKDNFNSWDELEKQIVKDNGPCIILPVYMYEHGGIELRTSSFSCSWDSGQVGFIFVTKVKIRKEYGYKTITKKRMEKIENILSSEVSVYSHYLNGDVYGYVIEDECGEEIDKCYGFYGYDVCECAANEALDMLK